MNHSRAIILASQSRQRKNIFTTLHIPFKIIPAHIDELAITATTETARAQKIALKKAEAISDQKPEAVIFAADTYVYDQDRVLEKPENEQQAAEMLRYMSNKELKAVTGYCCIDAGKVFTSTNVVTDFSFRTLTDSEIKTYVETQPVTTWSAAFSPAYDAGISLVKEMRGSFTSFTHGLPMELVVADLQKLQLL